MIKPQQRVSSSTKNTKEWKEENIRYFYKNCSGVNLTREEVLKLYRLAAGYLDSSEYLYATDPLGVRNRAALSGNPAGEIKNMDIISPILSLLMGEKTKRPNQYQAFAKNSDYPSQKSQRQMELWTENVHQMFVNEMINLGVYVPGQTDEQGQPVKEPDSPEEMDMKLSSLSDWMAIQAQECLDYIRYANELDRNFREGFYDWLVTFSVFSYKDVRYDDIVYEIIPVDQIQFLKSDGVRYLEDSQAVKRTKHQDINQLIDNFRDVDGMTDEIIKDLETWGTNRNETSGSKQYSASEVFYGSLFGKSSSLQTNNDRIEVCHIVWRSMQKQLKVKGRNVLGQEYEYTYDDTYTPLEGEEVVTSWIGQGWEGYMLGGKYVVGVQPLPIPRTSMSNESVFKLPYNGCIYHSREVLSKSVVARLEVYQKRYNVTYHFLEKVLNKNKDKMTILPLSMIPDKPGWDELTTLYYADATGFLFVDDSDPRTMQSLQYVKTLDMALSQYIEYIGRMLIQIKAEAEEMCGVNRQRKGDSMASDAVGNTQQATMRSVISTEELFVEYDEFEEKELQGLMDISKFAYVKGKKASYISSDGKVRYLDVVPESYQLGDYGVFVKNGGSEAEKLREFKQSAFAFAQNQMKPSIVAKVVDSDNLTKLVLELEKAEQVLDQQQQQAAEMENQNAQIAMQAEAKKADDELGFKYYKVDADNLTKRELALITPPAGDGTALKYMEQQTEREWQEVEREKNILKARTDKYTADKVVDAAKISAKSKNKS